MTLALLGAAALAFPNRLSPGCAQAQALAAGGAVTIHNVAAAPGTVLTATSAGQAITTTYTPGTPITLTTTGAGQWGFYVSTGATFNPPSALCAGQLLELTAAGTGTVVPPAAGGPLTIVGMRAAGRAAVTYQTLTLQPGAGGGVTPPPGGGGGGGIIGGLPPPPPPGLGGGIGVTLPPLGGGLDTSPTAIQQAKAAGRVLAIGTPPLMWGAMPQIPQQLTANVGTLLQFQYGATHNVWSLPDVASWTTCSMQQGTQLASQLQGGGLPTDLNTPNLYEGVITSGTPALFFACGIPGHCLQGLKVQVNVADGGGGLVGGVGLGSLGGCGLGGGGGFFVGWLLAIVLVLGGQCFVKRCREGQPPGPPPPAAGKGGGGWQAVNDPSSGRTYFYNAATGETRWDQP